MIPVFAFGPGAENFAGIYHNYDLFTKMRDALHLGQK
jgi:alkaline phosphatase